MVVLFLTGCPITGSIVLPDGEGDVGVDPTDSDSAEVIRDSYVPPGETADTGEPEVRVYVPEVPDVVVDCTGAGDFETISAAILASHSGAKIGLAPCTYTETINYAGKSLDIFSLEGLEKTVIDGGGNGPIVTVARGEGPGTRLAGVTLSGGKSDYASAVYIEGAMLSLEFVDITDNRDAYSVIYGTGCGLDLSDVSISNSTVSRQGAPFVVDNGFMRAQRLHLTCDGGTYGIYEHNVTLLLDSTIDCPRASYGVIVGGGEFQARRSRIVGGQLGIYGEDNADTLNERLWLFNTAVVADGTAVSVAYMHLKVENSVLYGNDGGLSMSNCHIESYAWNSAFEGGSCSIKGDNTAFAAGWNNYGSSEACRVEDFATVAGDPGFRDAPDDFALTKGSPLIDAGNPEDDHQDTDGSRADVGIYGGPEGNGEL